MRATQSPAAAKWQRLYLCVPVCTGTTSLCQRAAGAPGKKLHISDPKAAKRNIQAIQTLSAAEEAAFDSHYAFEGSGVAAACAAVQKQRYLLQAERQRGEEAQEGLSQLSAGWDRVVIWGL